MEAGSGARGALPQLHFAIKGLRMRPLKTLAAGLCLASLAACATVRAPMTPAAPPTPAATASNDADGDQGALYGLYLAGHKALDENHGREAADFFARAAASEPDAAFLKEAAFGAALEAGDVHRAAMLAPGPDEASVSAQRLGQLTKAVDFLAQGDGKAAQAALGASPLGPPHQAAGAILSPWVAAAAGDWKAALSLPDAQGDPLIVDITEVDQALLYEHRRRYAEAEAIYKTLVANPGAASIDAATYGQFLERHGRRDDAIAVYQAALKADSDNGLIMANRDRATAGGGPPPEPTFAQGASQALLAPAAAYLSERQPLLGLVYLELVLRLDPERDEAWILLGDALVGAGDIDSARDAYSHPQPGSPDYVLARGRLILTYQGQDDAPVALKLAQDTVQSAPDDDDALALLADALRVDGQYAESAKVLDTLIVHQGANTGWQLYYMRGVALAQSDQWAAAEQDLQKAINLKPDDPELLNFLGYSWVDRGEHLKEARAMIEKAVAAKPDSGAIVDSLGWANFKLGDFKAAVGQLERAATLEAADPDINDHLGDAYWQVGRRTEARFQWDKVLTLNPSDKLRGSVENKLRSGLGAPATDPSSAANAKPASAAA